jgi:hypothetical protein
MGALKDKVLDELYNNNYRDLYDEINKIKNDVDVANYINADKHHITQTMSDKDLEGMPNFKQALFGKLKTGKVDYNKEFGEDWYNNYEEIPYQEIKYIADKNGVDPKKLIHEMSTEATKLRRQDIANGDNPDASFMDKVGGAALSLFGRRQQEAIARGEDPSLKDYAGDIGEQAIYFAPYGAIAKGLSAGSKVGKVLTLGSNAIAPLATESYDAVAYDDSNPRGDFSVQDVASGTALNATAPWLVKSFAAAGGKALNVPNLTKKVTNYANVDQPVREDRISKLLGGLRGSPQSQRQRYNTQIKSNPELASQKLTAEQLNEGLNFDKDYKVMHDKLYAKLATRQGRWQGGDPTKKWRAGSANVSRNESMQDFTPEELQFIVNDAELREMLPSELSRMPTLEQIAGEEATKNYITNQYGNVWAEDQNPWTRLGFPGVAISDAFKDKESEEQRKKDEARILKELEDKYGTSKTYRLLKGDK